MKEFEKWWERNHPIYDSGDDTIREYQQAKAAWKAALEWVLERYYSEHEPVDFIGDIHEELEEE